MIISLNGKPGSGKSTVATRLAAALGYERIYIGGMRREMARRKGMTLQEFNAWSESHPEGDTEFDEYLTELGKTKDDFIIESRTAFHFIPHAIKIFLDVSVEVGSQRIWDAIRQGAQDRNEGVNLTDYVAVENAVRARLASDQLRYQKYYHLDIFSPAHYDLFLDTTDLTPEAEYRQVWEFVQSRLK